MGDSPFHALDVACGEVLLLLHMMKFLCDGNDDIAYYMLVGKKLDMSQQCELTAWKPPVSCIASPAMWAAGGERGFYPSAPLY